MNKILYAVANRLSPIIIGNKPFNTIFSFNYHNVKHIVRFLKRYAENEISTSIDLLDVGGGSSPYYPLFEKKVSSYTVLDVAESLPKNEMRNIKQVVGFAEKLPFPDNQFDVVLSNQVLEHVLDERLAVKESFRVLKPGGVFVGSVPHVSPIHLEPYDFRRFTNLGLQKLLSDAGFSEVCLSGNGSVYKAMSLSINMDRNLSKYRPGEEQKFLYLKHFYFSPITGFINVMGSALEFLFGNKQRTPCNYCWKAFKS